MKSSIYGKIFIVVLLTVLIWVWADLAQDERLPLSNVVSLGVARSSDPTLWLSFAGEGDDPTLQPSVMIDRVDLIGELNVVRLERRVRNTLGIFSHPLGIAGVRGTVDLGDAEQIGFRSRCVDHVPHYRSPP